MSKIKRYLEEISDGDVDSYLDKINNGEINGEQPDQSSQEC